MARTTPNDLVDSRGGAREQIWKEILARITVFILFSSNSFQGQTYNLAQTFRVNDYRWFVFETFPSCIRASTFSVGPTPLRFFCSDFFDFHIWYSFTMKHFWKIRIFWPGGPLYEKSWYFENESETSPILWIALIIRISGWLAANGESCLVWDISVVEHHLRDANNNRRARQFRSLEK